jgi:hypothetical protein
VYGKPDPCFLPDAQVRVRVSEVNPGSQTNTMKQTIIRIVPHRAKPLGRLGLLSLALAAMQGASALAADNSSSDGKKDALTVKEQHSEIGIPSAKIPPPSTRSIRMPSGIRRPAWACSFTGAFPR